MRAVLISAALAAASAQWPTRCPVSSSYTNWSETRCPDTQTCSPNGFSAGGGWGCCPWPNAVSCPSGFACCPEGSTCTLVSGSGYGTIYQCTGAAPPTTSKCPCKPGMPNPPSTTLKNVLVIGDSLTIGYTPAVAANLSDIALVQHAPWDTSDGGAEESSYFEQCLDNWLRSPSGIPFFPDLIYFNSGMHNLQVNGTGGESARRAFPPLSRPAPNPRPDDHPRPFPVPGQGGNASEYPAEMANVMERLVQFAASSGGKTRLVYGLTTPYLCDASVDGVISEELNPAAAGIASALGIEIVDMHGPIVNKCGPAGNSGGNCFGQGSCFCPHCNGVAYAWLADNVIAPALRLLLEM